MIDLSINPRSSAWFRAELLLAHSGRHGDSGASNRG
jgi:hypothetical protein